MNAPNSNPISKLRILIVDDEPIIRESIALMLEDLGAVTIIAASVQEALACLGSFDPDVVISDINMPGGDGFALIRVLQTQIVPSGSGRRLVAIAMTASASTTEQQRAFAAGFSDYLPKPFGQAQLIEAIRRGRGET